jgi:hypothetical protein
MVFICGLTNSMGTRNPMGTGMNFYPRVRVQISIRNLFTGGRVIAIPDLNPTRCHPYPLATPAPHMACGKRRVVASPSTRRTCVVLLCSCTCCRGRCCFAMLDDERSTWVTPGEDGPKAPGKDTNEVVPGEDDPKPPPPVLLTLINRLPAPAGGHDPRSHHNCSLHGQALCLGAARRRWRRTPSPRGCGSREHGRGDGAPGGHGPVRGQRAVVRHSCRAMGGIAQA